jgi:hypothetical protein
MNTISVLGLCLLALHGASQDAGLSKPPVDAQTRKPAVETTIVIHDVNDIVAKLAPGAEPDERLKQKIDTYLQHQDDAAHKHGSNDPKAGGSEMKKIGVDLESGPEAGPAGKSLPSKKLVATQNLADAARRYMQPAFEPDNEQLSAPSEGSLLATLRPDQQAWLTSFLEVQRRTTGLVEISCEVFKGPRGVFREIGLTAPSTVLEDQARVAAFRAQADEHKVDRMTSPRIAAMNGAKASLSVLDQVAYIQDWKLRIVEPGPQEIAEPTINIVQDGYVASMCATAIDDRTYGLDLSFVSSKLERPMQTRKIRLSATNDKEVEIGVPVVAKISFDAGLVLADGASVVFTTASPKPDKDLAIVVTLKHRSL